MCRWLAYRGAPIRTSELILHPTHSIVAQSLDSPLGAEPVNGDGFGFGWYPEGTGERRPGVFHSIEPAWHDRNLRELTQVDHVTAVLLPRPGRRRSADPADELPSVPARELAVHAQRGHLGVRAQSSATWSSRSTRSSTWASRARPTRRSCSASPSPSGCVTTRSGPCVSAIGLVETTGRAHGVRFPWQGTVAVSDGSHDLGLPVLDAGSFPVTVPLGGRRHPPGDVPGGGAPAACSATMPTSSCRSRRRTFPGRSSRCRSRRWPFSTPRATTIRSSRRRTRSPDVGR